MLLTTVACRIASRIARLPLPSVLLAPAAAASHQSVSVHSQGTRQLITSRTRASPQGRVPFGIGAADGLFACIIACACRPCSRPWSFTTTAAASWAAGGSTGGAAGKPRKVDCWSSSIHSRRGCNNEKPSSCNTNSAGGKVTDSDSYRPDAGAVWLHTEDRNTYDVNDDLKLCTSTAQLQQLLQQDGPAMTYVNLAAAIVKLQRILSKSTRQQQQQQVVQTADSLFNQLWQLQQPKLPQCKARELANMIYSVSLLPTPWQQQYQWVVAQHLLPAFMRQLSRANPQHVSNVLYGMAASGQQLLQESTELFVDQLVDILPNANTHDIANALWAVAKMQQQIQQMQLQRLLDAFCAVAQTAKPQEIANTLWAVATMQQQLQPMQLQQLLDAFCAIAQKAKPQEVANTLWAVAKVQQHSKLELGQLEQLLCAFVMQLSQAVPQAVSNTLLACAEFRYLPKQLLTAAGLLDKLATATPQQLANIAWACGQLGYRDEQLMSALLSRVLDLVGTSEEHLISSGVNAQTLANSCWSLAVLDLREHASAVLTLVQAGKSLWASMAPEGFLQLHQSHMWLIDHDLAGGQGLAGVLTARQLQQCQSTWLEMLQTTATSESSSFHQSVFKALQRISVRWLAPPAMEQVSLGADGQPDGAALIDITARTVDGVWLAIEADGPTHFRRPDRGLLGPTLYRNRALAVRGYVLISVPYREWDCRRSAKLKQQYLQDKVTAALQQAAVDRPHLQLEEVAQPQGVPERRHQHLISSSNQCRSAGSKLSQLEHGDPCNAAGNNFDRIKTSSRASSSVGSLGNTSSQGGHVRRTRQHKKDSP